MDEVKKMMKIRRTVETNYCILRCCQTPSTESEIGKANAMGGKERDQRLSVSIKNGWLKKIPMGDGEPKYGLTESGEEALAALHGYLSLVPGGELDNLLNERVAFLYRTGGIADK